MHSGEIGLSKSYRVHLGGGRTSEFRFKCVESGAFNYGNGTSITLDIEESDGYKEHRLFDTRYECGSFNTIVNEYMRNNIRPGLQVEAI